MNKTWTLKEESLLVQNYPTLGKFGCMKLLNKSEASIRNKAAKLKLVSKVTKILTDKEYKNRLHNYDIINIAPYIRSDIKIPHKHLSCGYVWNATPNNILRGTKCPKCSKKPYSKKAIRWIESLDKDAIHAENGGEFLIAGYKVDGFNPKSNIVYEFHGDCFHGNLDIYNPEDKPHPFNNKTAEELWCETYERMLSISKHVNSLVFIWESDYQNGKSECRF